MEDIGMRRKFTRPRKRHAKRKTRRLKGGNAAYTLVPVPSFIERINKEAPIDISGVPLNIYQTWNTRNVPPKMKDNIDKLVNMNPDFNYYLYSDEECKQFIKDNFDQDVLDAFNRFKPGAYKADLWRYCILYKLGGVYLDIKFRTLIPLNSIISANPEIFVLDIQASSDLCESKLSIYNGFIASPPGNSIFKDCIDSIVACSKEKCYKGTYLSISGPCLLGEILKKHKSEDVLSSIKFKIVNIKTGVRSTPATIEMNGTNIVDEYPEYRDEQANANKTEHYGNSWKNRTVYN
jgi:mannosyltransferase OCH1-like enzyme